MLWNCHPRCLLTVGSVLLSLVLMGDCDSFDFSPSYYGNIELRKMGGSSSQKPLGLYYYGAAKFGPSLPDEENAFKGVIHRAHPQDGCGKIERPPYVASLREPWVALIERSGAALLKGTKSCTFIDKVLNAQLAGYGGVIIYNYDATNPDPMVMDASNASERNRVSIPSVFVNYHDGMELSKYSFPGEDPNVTLAFFFPEDDPINPFKVLVPLAFSFVGILLITCIVMMVRWCQAVQRKRRSRVTKSQLRKIPLTRYSVGDQYDCCAICLDDYIEGEKLRVLPCSHTYHQKCIDPWLLKNKRTCPVCKRKVISSRRSGRSSNSRRPGNSAVSSATAQPAVSSDSEDAGPSTERTPLLPPPIGPSSQALLHSASTSRGNNYGSAGSGAVNITVSDTSSDDDDDGTSYGASYATISSMSYSTPLEGWHMRARISPGYVHQVHLPSEQPPATASTSQTHDRITEEVESAENDQINGNEVTIDTSAGVVLPPPSNGRTELPPQGTSNMII